MTEAEWLACVHPEEMLDLLRSKTSERKLRLFAVACYRQNPWASEHETCRNATEVAERFADGKAKPDELAQSLRMAVRRGDMLDFEYGPLRSICSLSDLHAAVCSSLASDLDVLHTIPAILREIYGNPFRPVTVDPAWRTATAVSLAQAIYEERAFDRLPILADALEDAGCTNADILDHCRQRGEHVRGCWVVDLIMDKK